MHYDRASKIYLKKLFMKNIFKVKLIYQIAAFALPLAVYLNTLAPSVWYIDSGELATVAAKLAIAHPTGYPLYTVLGSLFSKLPFGTPIYDLNLMCAVVSSLATLIFFNLLVLIATRLNLNKDKKALVIEKNKIVVYNCALAVTLILAFSKTFWDSATAVEVYSLHSFFLVLLIYLFLNAINHSLEKSDKAGNLWILFSFVLGLSFTNHLTTIFLSVGFIYLYFSVYGYNKESLTNILKSAVPFIIGFSFNLYLLVRSGKSIISWGEPDTFAKLFQHIFGRQYASLMFNSFDVASAQLMYFFEFFPMEFYIIPLILIIPGIIELNKHSKRMLILTLLLFLFNLFYAVNYNIIDIENYFLLIIIVSLIWIFYGIIFFIKKFSGNSLRISIISLLIFLIPLSQNYSANNKSGDYSIRNLLNDIYKSVPENSIIFAIQWNIIVSSSLYLNFVEHVRPDVIILNRDQLSVGWYINFIKKQYPELYEKSKEAFDEYYKVQAVIESDPERYKNPLTDADKYEVLKLQAAFKKLVDDIVNKNYNDRSIFITYETEEDKQIKVAAEYPRIPQGLLFKLSKDTVNYDGYIMPEFNFSYSGKTDFNESYKVATYMQAYMGRANYLMKFGKYDEAENLLNKVAVYFPNKPEVVFLQKKLNRLKGEKESKKDTLK